MKKYLLAAALFVAMPFMAPPAHAEMTKAEVEQTVRDLLDREPELIIKAAQNAQAKEQQKQLEAASVGIKDSGRDLYQSKSPATGASVKDADVTIVEFYDYNCGYCKKAQATVKQLLAADKKVRVVFKEFPILGPTSLTGAQYAMAAGKQGKFVEFHNKLMESHDPVTEDELAKFGADLKLDAAKLKADANSAETKAAIDADLALGRKVGVQGTPGFVIGDKLYPGAMDLAMMQKVVAEARAAKK